MLLPAKNRKGEVFLPLLAIFTWLILGIALITMIIGVIELDKKTVATSALSLSDTNLRAEIAKINLERMKEFSYCSSVKELAEDQGIGVIGENPTCYLSENYLLKEFQDKFTNKYISYLSDDELNHEQGAPNDITKFKSGYYFDGNNYIFSGGYDYLKDRLSIEVKNEDALSVTTTYKLNDYDKTSQPLPTFKRDKLNFVSIRPPRIDVNINPYFDYTTGYSLDEYKEILEKIKANKECIMNNPECNLGNNWKFNKMSENAYNFEITSEECKPFGNIAYKFSINLNTIDEAVNHWGDEDLKPLCGKKVQSLF